MSSPRRETSAPPLAAAAQVPLFRYRLHGLDLTFDRPVAELSSVRHTTDRKPFPGTDGETDVRIRFARWPHADRHAAELGGEPTYRSPFLDAAGRSRVSGWSIAQGRFSWFVRSDGLEFVVDDRGREVWIDSSGCDPDAGNPDVVDYLLGPVTGLVLRRRGVVCLHATVVVVNGFAVALAGPEGVGKSSVAAALALRGHAIVTDDLAALTDGPRGIVVQPGVPSVQVRRGALEAYAESIGARARLCDRPGSDYLEMRFDGSGARASSPRTLEAIYVLDPCARTRVEPLTGAAAVMTLASDTWARALLGPAECARELDVLVRLVAGVPITRMAAGRPTPLQDLVETIEADRRRA